VVICCYCAVTDEGRSISKVFKLLFAMVNSANGVGWKTNKTCQPLTIKYSHISVHM